MTTQQPNEAAERLHSDLWDGMDPPVYDTARALPIIREALAAERRATVERIRKAMFGRRDIIRGDVPAVKLSEVLDEEAAR